MFGRISKAMVLLAVGCGNSIDSPVDDTRPLTSLDADELLAICEAVETYRQDESSRERRCASKLMAEARQPMSVIQYDADACERFERCVYDPPPVEIPTICYLPCYANAELCTATVGEYLACRQAGIDAGMKRRDRYECSAESQEFTSEEIPECTVLANRCRDPEAPRLVLTADCFEQKIVLNGPGL